MRKGFVLAAAGWLSIAVLAGCQQAPPAPANTAIAVIDGNSVVANTAVITPDGRYVAFTADDPALVSGSALLPDEYEVYRLDRDTDTTVLVSDTSSGAPVDSSNSIGGPGHVSISDDGNFVAYSTSSGGVVAGDTNGVSDVFVRDVSAGTTQLVSQSQGGAVGNGGSDLPRISHNGAYVSFRSVATNLGPTDTNGLADVYRWTRATGAITEISIGHGGAQATGASDVSVPLDNGDVAFTSAATNLLATTLVMNESGVFLRDTAAGTTTLVSQHSNGSFAGGSLSDATPDGHFVSFTTDANLVAADTDRNVEVYLRNMQTGTTQLALTLPSGASVPDNGGSLSSNGAFVTARTAAPGVVAGDTGTTDDGFIRNLATGATYMIDRKSDGSNGYGIDDASSLDITTDGHTAVFITSNHYTPDDGTYELRGVITRTPVP